MNLRTSVGSVLTRLTSPRRASTKRIASGTALALVSGVLVVMAVQARGVPITEVDLNDGSVWVSKNQDGIVARLNSQVQELDLGVVTRANNSSLYQRATDVRVDDQSGTTNQRLVPIDVAGGAVGKAVEVSKTVVVASGKGVVAMVDTKSGRGWVKPADAVDGFKVQDEPAVHDLGRDSVVAVGDDGTAYFLDRVKSAIVPVTLDVNKAPVVGDAESFKGDVGQKVAMTVVGTHPVVLDQSSGTLVRPGASPEPIEDADGAQLQQPQAEGAGDENVVHLATGTGLYATGVTGGGLTKISTAQVSGPPAAPVVVAGCVYAAWNDPASTGSFERVCGGKSDGAKKIPTLSSTATLVFRVNRDVVVLNDAAGGTSWMVQAGMEVVDNWDAVDPRKKQEQEAVENEQQDDPNRNDPPTAVDDTIFGARPGATVVLPVTVNDTDPDGDILTVSPDLQLEGGGDTQLSIVGNGTEVQAKVGANTKGEVRFTYAVTDGQPGHAESADAVVTLKIVDPETDNKPALLPKRENELTVAKGHEAQVNVLPAWYDPDGDTLVLTNATSKGGDVRWRPDGTITFADDGSGSSAKTIDFTLQGREASENAKVVVSVVDPAKAAPTPVADRVTGIAGNAISVEPLVNDANPLGGPMELASLKPQPAFTGQVQVSFDRAKGVGQVTAAQAGTYYLDYIAANESASAPPQVVRVDVIPVATVNHPPVAERDTANLLSGRSALVDMLANDSDPDGDVLVVRGFSAIPDGLKVSLIDKRFARVEAVGPLDPGKEIGYQLSDGGDTVVEGSIAVSRSEGDQNRPPVAQNDQFTARAGTVITLPVLANDSDPDGDNLTVDGEDLVDVPQDVPVTATGSALRVLVPKDGRTELELGYTARDPLLAGSTARVVVNILPDDKTGNEAPRPAPIEERVISGQRVRIPISAYDSDPDGDPVSLVSVVQQPTLGRIVATGVDWVDYQAYVGAAGPDRFRIQVTDQYGAKGYTDVRLGVAKPNPVNQPPAALDDEIFVKPGRTIQYAVRTNDSDPDGDGFSLLPTLSKPDGVKAQVTGDFVEMTSPSLDGKSDTSATVQYGVTDLLGGESRANFTVTSSDRAPEHAPIATDDVVPLSKVAGRKPGAAVPVDVLANDGDIDGPKSALKVEALPGGTVVGAKLQVTLAAEDQVVPYRLVDGDGQASYGFVYVSGTDSLAPTLDQSKMPLTVVAGAKLSIDLTKIIDVRAGHEPRIARTDQITITNGDNTAERNVGDQTLVFRANKSYHGPASIQLDVIDGTDLNDPDGLSSQITIPIEVKPATNVPPTVRSTAVSVAAGGDPVEISTAKLAEDANDDKLTFQPGPDTRGVSAEVDGGVIKVSADKGAKVPDEVELGFTVSDGTAAPVSGTISVSVTDSTKPLMTLVNPITVEGTAGEPVTVELGPKGPNLVTDPFPGETKKVSDVATISGKGAASVAGTTMTVTPEKGFTGVLVIGFRMDDGSHLASRTVSGRIEVTVADKPDPPGRPTATSDGPTSVLLSWSAPDSNGKPIDQYRIRWNGGEKPCPGTQCLIDNLDPGTEYTFTVAAHNAVEWSDESPRSAPVTPDQVPDKMAAPTIDPATAYPARDKKLKVSWTAPNSPGSAITGYELRQEGGGTIKLGAGELSKEVQGLTNGQAYRFSVRAINSAKNGESVWSNPSEASTPFTKPGPVGAPRITTDPPDDNGTGHVSISWSTPADNGGDPNGITDYKVEVLADGNVASSKTATGTTADFTVPNGKRYSARITARNNAGTSDTPMTSGEVTVYDKSGAPTNLHQTGADGDKEGTLAFTTPADNGGYPVTKYRVTTSDGSDYTVGAPTSAKGASATLTIKFQGNHDTGQWVQLVPITSPENVGETAGSPGRSGSEFKPFGDPDPPGSNGFDPGYKQTTVRWTGGGANGRPIEKTEYRGDAAGTAGGGGGSATIATNQGGDRKCVQARAYAGGRWSSWSGDICGTSQNRTVTVTKGGAASQCAGCNYVNISVTGFASNTTQYADISLSGDSNWCAGATNCQDPRGFSVGADGRGSLNNYFYNGYKGTVTVVVDGVSGSVAW